MALTIRAYNVLFGDCILISWDEADGEHHAWVDFGNFHNDKNEVFGIVYKDVLPRTDGLLDLVVVTHRHLDHMEGFFTLRKKFKKEFEIDRLWHAHVTKSTDDIFELADKTMRSMLPVSALDGEGVLGRVYRNNHYIGTKDRMDGILEDFPGRHHAIHREVDPATVLPDGMRRLQVEIIAPERNSKTYFEPLEQGLASRQALERYFGEAQRKAAADAPAASGAAGPAPGPVDSDHVSPLEGLADFERLRRRLRTGGLGVLAAVDRTRNNTSIVLRLTYGRTRVLLTGDAEEKSWSVMRDNGAEFSSTAVKVGHHGSINASPAWSFNKVLSRKKDSNAVIVSTDPSRFDDVNKVPHEDVLAGWRSRITSTRRLLSTDKVDPGESVAVTFAD
jgi:hypothetical protein